MIDHQFPPGDDGDGPLDEEAIRSYARAAARLAEDTLARPRPFDPIATAILKGLMHVVCDCTQAEALDFVRRVAATRPPVRSFRDFSRLGRAMAAAARIGRDCPHDDCPSDQFPAGLDLDPAKILDPRD